MLTPAKVEQLSAHNFVAGSCEALKRQLEDVTGVTLALNNFTSSRSRLMVVEIVDPLKLTVVGSTHGVGSAPKVRDEVVSVCGLAVPDRLFKSEMRMFVAELRVLLWVYHTIAKDQLATRSGAPHGDQSFVLELRHSQLATTRAIGRFPSG
jgi:hypothetical protein